MPHNSNYNTFDHKKGDDYFLESPERIRARIAAIFANRGLDLNHDRLERLVSEVQQGRSFNDIRTALEPYRKDGGGGPTKDIFTDAQREELKAALEAINAKFDLKRGDLESRRGNVRRAFERLKEDLGEQRTTTLDRSKEQSAGAGRIRSGLFVEEQADIANRFADALTRARADRTSKLSDIQRGLSALDAQRESTRAQRARKFAREVVGTKEAIARALELV